MRGWRSFAVCALLLSTSRCWAYRPYDSTDADVAADHEVELELGWRRTQGESDDDSGVPVVFNLGIGHDREINLEGEWTDSTVRDLRFALKTVHRGGSLQGGAG